MQTFLPYPDFTQCAKCLDQKRLGKQRVECLQLLQNQYRGHPLYKMWRGYEYHLATYGIEICCEWLDRGFQDTCLEKISQIRNTFVDNGPPFWLGDERLHRSHRSNLLRKNWEHYIQFGWKENPTIPYFWPVE
ncbi:MAG: MSMEG_6728 family protein [Patescibacteria group bacterium]|nr:MSMEG_6728 family protein [Patescibacteria group bacterium]